MTSSKISFPHTESSHQIWRNKPDARCNTSHITPEKLALKKKKNVKISIIYSVINSDWIGALGVSINILSFAGFYHKSWQILGTEGQIYKTGLSQKNKKTLISNFFSSQKLALFRASTYVSYTTPYHRKIPSYTKTQR